MSEVVNPEKIETISRWLQAGSINVFGMPLAGKDTQCQSLAELLGAETFGGGDILRSSVTTGQLKADIDQGKLAPTDEYLAMVMPYFQKSEFLGKPLVLSSVGRWQGEEDSVLQAAVTGDHPIKAVIYLELDQAEAAKRLAHAQRNRVDDDESKLQTRFNEFIEKTQPVLETYRKHGLLAIVDGNQSVEAVTQSIIDALYEKATKQHDQGA